MLVRRVWPSRPTFESPFTEVDQLRRDLQRLFDGTSGDGLAAAGAGVFPPINVTQDDNHFYVRAEVPGLKPSELEISALRNRLSIAGKREIAQEHGRASYHRRERPEGAFNRVVVLPGEVDSEKVEARYSDGVLGITLPKTEAMKPRQIAVKN